MSSRNTSHSPPKCHENLADGNPNPGHHELPTTTEQLAKSKDLHIEDGWRLQLLAERHGNSRTTSQLQHSFTSTNNSAGMILSPSSIPTSLSPSIPKVLSTAAEPLELFVARILHTNPSQYVEIKNVDRHSLEDSFEFGNVVVGQGSVPTRTPELFLQLQILDGDKEFPPDESYWTGHIMYSDPPRFVRVTTKGAEVCRFGATFLGDEFTDHELMIVLLHEDSSLEQDGIGDWIIPERERDTVMTEEDQSLQIANALPDAIPAPAITQPSIASAMHAPLQLAAAPVATVLTAIPAVPGLVANVSGTLAQVTQPQPASNPVTSALAVTNTTQLPSFRSSRAFPRKHVQQVTFRGPLCTSERAFNTHLTHNAESKNVADKDWTPVIPATIENLTPATIANMARRGHLTDAIKADYLTVVFNHKTLPNTTKTYTFNGPAIWTSYRNVAQLHKSIHAVRWNNAGSNGRRAEAGLQ